jgi:hypothetical protein
MKDFGEKNAPKLPDFEDFFSLAEFVILKTTCSNMSPKYSKILKKIYFPLTHVPKFGGTNLAKHITYSKGRRGHFL